MRARGKADTPALTCTTDELDWFIHESIDVAYLGSCRRTLGVAGDPDFDASAPTASCSIVGTRA